MTTILIIHLIVRHSLQFVSFTRLRGAQMRALNSTKPFWATVCKRVCPTLSDRCLSCPVCPICLWR